MTIKRITFKNDFNIESIPDWICPTCNKGVLKYERKNIKTFEGALSLSAHGHPAWEPDWINGVFLGLLKCSNPSCNETVVMTGDFRSEEGQEYDEMNNRYNLVLNKFLIPSCFNPPMKIFQINDNVPEEIRDEIIKAFNVYWIDVSSCSNKIRVVVELIMDNRKVKKTFIHRGKRKGYTLHKRIEFFKLTNPEEADLLMAIKWIGNTGSHRSDNLTRDDILDGLEILEHVLTKLYETDTKRIATLTKKINKRKKPLGKSKS